MIRVFLFYTAILLVVLQTSAKETAVQGHLPPANPITLQRLGAWLKNDNMRLFHESERRWTYFELNDFTHGVLPEFIGVRDKNTFELHALYHYYYPLDVYQEVSLDDYRYLRNGLSPDMLSEFLAARTQSDTKKHLPFFFVDEDKMSYHVELSQLSKRCPDVVHLAIFCYPMLENAPNLHLGASVRLVYHPEQNRYEMPDERLVISPVCCLGFDDYLEYTDWMTPEPLSETQYAAKELAEEYFKEIESCKIAFFNAAGVVTQLDAPFRSSLPPYVLVMSHRYKGMTLRFNSVSTTGDIYFYPQCFVYNSERQVYERVLNADEFPQFITHYLNDNGYTIRPNVDFLNEG